jgi:long-chain acyl-CoA synthetase
MYNAIVNYCSKRQVNLSSVRACISGGASLPPSVQKEFEKLTRGHLVEGYGLTEAAPITHCNPLRGKRKLGSIGLPLPNTEARIVDLISRQPLRQGQIGELQVRGPQVMSGYWRLPSESEQVLHHDGWLSTGDLGYRDEEGYFFIVDRKKEIIFCGGYNIYPSEVERVLLEHEAVAEAAVMGVSDQYYGSVVTAFVVLREGQQAAEEELIQFCYGKLAKFKIPRAIHFRQELPRNMLGKVIKRQLSLADRMV